MISCITMSDITSEPKYLYPPQRFQGYLLKDSPAPWRRCGVAGAQAQMRFVVVSEGRIFWSENDFVDSAGVPVEISGVVDLMLNDCELVDDGGSAFLLVPKQGKWCHGDFTGVSRGRVFRFDTTPSATKKRQWMVVLREHLRYAAASRASSAPCEPNMLPSLGSFSRSMINSDRQSFAAPEIIPSAPGAGQDCGGDDMMPIVPSKLKKTPSEKRSRLTCWAMVCECLCAKHPITKPRHTR